MIIWHRTALISFVLLKLLPTEMNITKTYLLGIALLMYMSYAARHDTYKQKQQEAQIHHEYCASFPQKCR